MRIQLAAIAAFASILAGCGSGQEHVVKPLKVRPMPQVDFQSLTSQDEKIKFIQNTKAPENVKQDAIAKVKSGQL